MLEIKTGKIVESELDVRERNEEEEEESFDVIYESVNIESDEFHESDTPKDPVERATSTDSSMASSAPMKDNGALRAGEAPVYNSPEILALLCQYACVGLLYGALGGMGYQLFIQYFHMEGYQYTAAVSLVQLGWSLKVFIGIISDCFPMFGLRRKPYMILGWFAAGMLMLLLSLMDHGDPYFSNPEYKNVPREQYTQEMKDSLNPGAVYNGTTLSIIAGAVTVCYLFADVPADALVVEYAQREPSSIRGRLQTMIYATRTLFEIIPFVLLGFGMNDATYGGTFHFALSINAFFAILVPPCFVAAAVTYFFIQERSSSSPMAIGQYLNGFWSLIQKRATWQVMIFSFLFHLLNGGIKSNAAPYVQELWVGVDGLTQNIIAIVSNLVLAGVMTATGRWGTNWNWRYTIVITVLVGNSIDSVVQFLAIYDIVREPWFYMGVPLTELLPYGVQFMVSTFIIVELAEVGNEGVMYGLLTTVANLPAIFGSMITNLINSQFAISAEEIASDSSYTRNQVAYTYLIYYGTTLLACCCVVILPRQKDDVQRLKEMAGDWPIVGGFILFFMLTVLIISVTSNVLSMFERTSCLTFAGGQGCD